MTRSSPCARSGTPTRWTRAGSRSSTAARRKTHRSSPSTCVATRRTRSIKQRLREVDDELEIVIVKDMMLTGYDSPPLHTLYLDRPLKGALLMQTLARVNRTFRGKQDGLLVAYAPLAENLHQALAEYTAGRPGRRGRWAATSTRPSRSTSSSSRRCDAVLRGLRLAERLDRRRPKAWIRGCGRADRLPALAADSGQPGRRGRGDARRAVPQAERPAGPGVGDLVRQRDAGGPERREVQFYEEVRVYMAKFDADERRSRGEPVPEELQRLLVAADRGVAPSPVRSSTSTRRPGCRSRASCDLSPDFVAAGAAGQEPAPGDRGAARPADRGSRARRRATTSCGSARSRSGSPS